MLGIASLRGCPSLLSKNGDDTKMGLFAGLLNLMVAGTGYLVQGKLLKAIGTFTAAVVFGVTIIGLPISLLIVLYTAYDAYKN